ncbi:hypothetical protein ID866_11373 [Astraeus odoratus]|nr:hypothetical protein ID866_11373 [Astraeus odoratus]
MPYMQAMPATMALEFIKITMPLVR